MLVSELADKKVLIVGFGSEGQDSFLFLRKHFPKKNIGIADKKEFSELSLEAQTLLRAEQNVKRYFGRDYLEHAQAYDVLVKSPGIPSRVLNPMLRKKHICIAHTNLFFANCKSTIIGVTGTKGKSTTASLIYEVLKAANKKAYLVGNIEQPGLSFLANAKESDIFVYELSSAQLETATQSPHIAVFLNFYSEHLDFHGTLIAYRRAKTNITKFQNKNDYFVFNAQNETVAKIAESSRAKKLPFSPKKQKSSSFIASTEPVFLVAKILHISKTTVERAIKKFRPLPHRLEPAGTHKGIVFYNDSLATIPQATMAALNALGKNAHTLIAGGLDRGVPMEKLVQAILNSEIQTLILFPTTWEFIAKEIRKTARRKKLPQIFSVNSMATAVQLAYDNTPKGKICLLSPAAASFNLFENYKERGEEFKKFVALYAKKKSA